MRTRSVLLVLVLLAAVLLPAVGCGSGGATSPAGATRIGPFVFALPYAPGAAGQVITVGFKNAFAAPATVYATRRTPLGMGAPVPFTVPALGELRVPLSAIAAGTPGGWICVDTRDVTAIDPATGEPTPVATSGYVFPYIHRETIGGNVEQDSFEGVTGRATGVAVAFTPATNDIQIVNYSLNQATGGAPAMPLPITFSVTTFNPDGTLAGAPAMVPVSANGSAIVAPLATPGNVGSVRIEPVVVPPPPPAPLIQKIQYAACGRESTFQTHAELRFHETSIGILPQQVDYGFEVEFGQDAFLNTHDFEFLMSNTSGTNQTVVLQAVLRKGELPLLTIPRAFLLNAGRTVLMRTRTVDSIGLNVGEASFFDDIFGDVFAATDFDEVTLLFQVPRTVDVSMRHHEPATMNFYRIVRALPRTNAACVYDLPIQEFLTTGIRNVVSMTNDSTSPLSLAVRAYTPGGTLYLLDPIIVPPLERFDWTPDGLTFREVPTDTIGPFVKYMRFEFFPPGGIFFRGRTTSSDALGIIRFITPTANRGN